MIKVLIAAFFAAPILVYSGGSEAQDTNTNTKSFRDWSVTCNNIRSCAAFSVSPASEGGIVTRPLGVAASVDRGWIVIERDAGPTAIPTILISRPELDHMPELRTASLRLVSADGRLVRAGQFALVIGRDAAMEIPASQNVAFMAAARSATHAIFLSGTNARPAFFVSLSGLVASARSMDAHQGRTGSVNALVDIGQISNARVPFAQDVPTLNARSFSQRINVRPPARLLQKRQADCDDAARFDVTGTNIEAYTLDRTRTLWSVPCGSGAYNTSNRFYIQGPRDVIIAANFIGTGSTDPRDANSLVNSGIDPDRGIITTFNKARGMGDCGIAMTFAWTGQAFVAATRNEMVPCGGITRSFWPSILASRVITNGQR